MISNPSQRAARFHRLRRRVLLRFRQLIAVAGASLLAAGVAACGNDEDETTAPVDTTTAVKALPSPCADVEYEGEGEPDALIASDLPMQGDSAERSEEMVEAIRLALDDADWRGGDTNVAFQACDDSIAKTGLWDAKTCRDNATESSQAWKATFVSPP